MSATTAPRKTSLTPQEYLALERAAPFRSEYANGRIVAMAGGTTRHSRICVNLLRRIDEKLDKSPCFCLDSNALVKIEAAKSYRYPDLLVVCDKIEHEDNTQRVLLNPTAVIEVLPPTTEKDDRTWKLFEYQQIPSLKEIINVEQHVPIALRFTRQDDGSWAMRFFAGLDATLEFASIPVSIPLAEVYDRVEFPKSEEQS